MNRENSKVQNAMQNAKPGEIITFGTCPQTADGTDVTPIKWRVLHANVSAARDGVRPALKINLVL